MSSVTQVIQSRSLAEEGGNVKFPDMRALSEDELAALMYGIPHNMLPLEPQWDPNNALKWPVDLQPSSPCKPSEDAVLPPDAVDPPDMWYATAYHPHDAPHFRDRYCKITTPPNISQPQFVNGKATLEPVPGMVKMVPGIPYVYEVCGDPAKIVTTDTQEAHHQIGSILKILHDLYALILPLSVSANEWDVLEYVMAEHNMFTFGGGRVGPVGCQLNISSMDSGGALIKSIGGAQGSWHVDAGDDPMTHTLVTMLLRIPPGSDPGAFCLGRPGLYVREIDTLVIFLLFKGNDIHSGCAPCLDPSGPGDQLYSGFEVWENNFGSQLQKPWDLTVVGASERTEPQNYVDNGRTILGSSYDECITRESMMQAWNMNVRARIPPLQLSAWLSTHASPLNNGPQTFSMPLHRLHEIEILKLRRAKFYYMQHLIDEEYCIMLCKQDLQQIRSQQVDDTQSTSPSKRKKPSRSLMEQEDPITVWKSQCPIQKKRRLDHDSSDSESISDNEPENDVEKSFEVEDIVDSMLVETLSQVWYTNE
ncbi:hypothetical protein EV702DRAFT_1047189 [Suillus placidus]|uniref:Uncharacterized protein n=1 Tax=Suillus placidus TaxID=48579 RepID=A0A9P7D0X3_9AGAM|nr:hypothetical protein EV702DRAFT_1047189 [Suillus placidus]